MKHYFYYTDSCKQAHKVFFELHGYNNLMELIWDNGYEDWGDCKGRAWCGTCHIQLFDHTKQDNASIDVEERKCLSRLDNRKAISRLACQILLDKKLHARRLAFLGDDDY